MSATGNPFSDRDPCEPPPAAAPVMRIRRISELSPPPPTTWLARGWLPDREITVLVGEEGIGKSLAWVRWVAHITTGRADTSINMPARQPRDVVAIVTEDSLGEVMARLKAAGADLKHVALFSSNDDGTGTPIFGNKLSGDMAALDMCLDQEGLDVALVVVDSWVDTVASGLSLRDSQQARQALHPWKILAQKHEFAVVLVTHTNRMNTGNTRDLMGSTAALRQKARMVLFAARSPEDKAGGGQFVWIGPEKSNVTGRASAVRYRLDVLQDRVATDDDPGTTARLAEPHDTGAPIGDLVFKWQLQNDANQRPSKLTECQRELSKFVMAQGGACSTRDLKDHLRGIYGKGLVEKVMSSMGESRRNGFGGDYSYTLREEGPKDPSEAEMSGKQEKYGKHESTDNDMFPMRPVLPELPAFGTAAGKMTGPLQGGDPCTTCVLGAITEANARIGVAQCLDCLHRAEV